MWRNHVIEATCPGNSPETRNKALELLEAQRHEMPEPEFIVTAICIMMGGAPTPIQDGAERRTAPAIEACVC